MKRHLQCAEQQVSRSNLTKYCACHEKNDSTALSSSHMKRHFQCAEQQVSLSNLTKYCACHEKWHCKMSKKISKNRWNVISNAGPIRPWSEHDPTMIRPWKRKPQPASPQVRLTFRAPHGAFSIVTYETSFQCAEQQVSHPTSPNTAPVTQKDSLMKIISARSNIWNLIYNARSNRCHDPTSPNTAPVTQKDSHT